MVLKPTQLVPITKEVIEDMRYILSRIDEGAYDHDQTVWHCGTRHCFAGWKEWKDFAKTHGAGKAAVKTIIAGSVDDYTLPLRAFRKTLFPAEEQDRATVAMYAGRAWGLTQYEAADLFDGDTSLDEMDDIISLLAKGLRKVWFDWPDEEEGPHVYDDDWRWIDPNNPPAWYIRMLNEGRIKIEDLMV